MSICYYNHPRSSIFPVLWFSKNNYIHNLVLANGRTTGYVVTSSGGQPHVHIEVKYKVSLAKV